MYNSVAFSAFTMLGNHHLYVTLSLLQFACCIGAAYEVHE